MLIVEVPPTTSDLSLPQVLSRRWRLTAAAADWVLPAALVLICGLIFHQIFLGGHVFPWDFVSWNYPMQRFVGESLRAGEWPLWNPRVMLGYPIMGDVQANIFNPLFLLYHLLPGTPLVQPNTLAMLEAAYIALAGVSAYCLARHFRLAPLASFLAGLVFMLSGFFPVHVEHTAWVVASAWLPLFLLLAARLLERFQLRTLLGLGAVTALSIFSGYPQTTLWSLYLVAAYFAWWSVPRLRARQWRTVGRSGLLLGSALALGLALAAVQVVPLLEFTLHSTRGAQSFARSPLGGLEPGAWLTPLLPKLFGSDGRFAWLGREVTQTQKYLGLLPLVLTLVGAGLACRPATAAPLGRDARFFLGLTVIALWGSLGASFYLYRAFELLPLMTLFRRASTLFPVALLGMAMLSGLAFEHLLRAPAHLGPGRPRPARFGGGAGAAALLLGLLLCAFYALVSARPAGLQALLAFGASVPLQNVAAPAFAPTLRQLSLGMLLVAGVLGLLLVGLQVSNRWRPVFVAALLVFTAFDLYWFNARQIFSVSGQDPFESLAELPPVPVPAGGLGGDRLALDRFISPLNFGLFAGVEEMGGYNPLGLRRVVEYVTAVPSLSARSFDLLNVRYLLVTQLFHQPDEGRQTFALAARRVTGKLYLPQEELDPQKFALRATSYSNWYELWENQQALPRFFAASQYRVLPSAAERLALIAQPDFDPSQTVILEQPLDVPLAGHLAAPVQITAYARNAFELEATVTGGSTLFVMSVPAYPGWQATVDGQPAPILAADHAFMALVLPPGAHTVRLAFKPMSFYLGLWVSGLAAALCVGLCGLRLARRRQGRAVTAVPNPPAGALPAQPEAAAQTTR